MSYSLAFVLLLASQSYHADGRSTRQVSGEENVISIVETGVARKREVTTKISCADVQWQVSWKSDITGSVIDAEITYFADGSQTILHAAAGELKAKIEDLASVSATCNPARDGRRTVSVLLLSATDKETSERLLGQLRFNHETSEAKWSFSPRGD